MQSSNSETSVSLIPPVPSDSGTPPSALVVFQATLLPTDPSPAASTKSVSSALSKLNASPSKSTRGRHSRKASLLHAAPSPQPRMTTCAMHHAEELQQALDESKAAASQSSTTSNLPLFHVTVSAPTSQLPPQEPPLILAVEDDLH